MTQFHLQQRKHKLTGSCVNNFKNNKKKRRLSIADKLFICAGILFLLYLFSIAIR